MIVSKNQKEEIYQRIDFIQIQLGDLKQFDSLDWQTYSKDRDIQRNIERLIENVANASIDIGKLILSGENVEMPNSYKEIILKLWTIDILEETVAGKLADYAQLRNFLAHEYLDLKWDKIKKFIKDARQDYTVFFESISKKIAD